MGPELTRRVGFDSGMAFQNNGMVFQVHGIDDLQERESTQAMESSPAEEPRTESPKPDTYLNRMVRASKLDVSLYREVKSDPGAMMQAMGVVILSSLCAGVGSVGKEAGGGAFILLGTGSALAGWFIWAWLTYFVGTRFLPEPQTQADYGQLLRTIGFSSAPGMIRILGLIPEMAMVVFFAASIWMLIAMVIAVRVALNYTSTRRAVAVCAVGWLVQILVLMLLIALTGGVPQLPVPT